MVLIIYILCNVQPFFVFHSVHLLCVVLAGHIGHYFLHHSKKTKQLDQKMEPFVAFYRKQ